MNSENEKNHEDRIDKKKYNSDYFRKPFLESYIHTEVKELKDRIFELKKENQSLKEENDQLKEDMEHTSELIERWKSQAEIWKKRYDDILDIQKFEEQSYKTQIPSQSATKYHESPHRPKYTSDYSSNTSSDYDDDSSLIDEILDRAKEVLKPYGDRGILQADLQRILSNYDRRRVGEAVNRGVDQGKLLKIKEGRTFRVKLKLNDIDADDVQLPGAI